MDCSAHLPRRFLLAVWLVAGLAPDLPAATPERVRVGCDDDYAPYFTRDSHGQPVGFAVDVFREAAREAGLLAEMRVDSWGSLANALKSGKLDILLTTPGPPVPTNALATEPFFISRPVLYGRVGETLRPDLPEAEGASMGMVRHETGPGVWLQPGQPRVKSIPLGSQLTALRLLSEGDVDLVVINRHVAATCVRDYRITGVTPLQQLRGHDRPYPFFVRAERPDLVKKLNAALAKMKADGRYNRLFDRWFGVPVPPPPELHDYLPYVPAIVLGLVLLAFLHVWRLEQRTLALREEVLARERLQARLSESEDQFRQIAENINEVFWVSSVDRAAIFYVSPAYERIWGRTAASLLAQPRSWLDAVHPEDRARVGDHAVAQPAAGRYDETYRIVRPDGDTRWIRDRAFPVQDRAGLTARLVGIAEDITDQRRALERIEQLNREQEAVVAQRTAELTRANEALLESQARLLEAQKMEAIGTLAGGIAHDFNNILGAIMGYSELLQLDEALPGETREALREISRAGQRGADMIRQILTFSRGRPTERRPINLLPVLQESLRLMRSVLPATVEIVPDLDPELATVQADSTQMQQVLMNLCTNAAHAMRDRSGRLEVALRNETLEAETPAHDATLLPGRYVVLSVRDSGVGIPEAVLPRIFDPFFTTKPAAEGTGLGLSVVHGIVKDHGGGIVVASRPQVGTVFRIYLPAWAGTVAAPREEPLPTRRGRGERILFVDDEPPMAEMARRLLTQLGYEPTIHTRPQEALEAFMKAPQRFDLVVTDLNMPRLSGIDLARVVHATDSTKPILLISGVLMGETFPPREETGICEMLAKPFTMRQLAAALSRLFDGRSGAGKESPP